MRRALLDGTWQLYWCDSYCAVVVDGYIIEAWDNSVPLRSYSWRAYWHADAEVEA